MKMKKIVVCLIAMLSISMNSFASMPSYPLIMESSSHMRADIIDWRYKTENGKLYRRQFNYSKNEWIGEWEFVGNIS